ncbi:hypothetical protein [Granulicella arctica]|uniref:hypothetical protein n=1 Tax=Granulicella arctica TaxID=940613 RepID=UPI0021E0DDBB|nr:hypothetical protein [Granulicella arctica]
MDILIQRHRVSTRVKSGCVRSVGFLGCAVLIAGPLFGQTPKEIVQQAVQTEIAASRNDHSLWRYRQEEKVPAYTVSIVVETSHGSIKQKVEQDGHPLAPEQTVAEMKRIQSFIHDAGQQQKQKRDGEHDDESAAKLLQILPEAFTWRVASQTPEVIILKFEPDPGFHPPDMESHVMSTMGGQLIVDRVQHRIRSIRGTLSQDVNIGYGLLGKLRQGGTFDVERRELTPGLWQIVETHVHIDGRALLFKTIGQQQDEVNSGFTRVPDSTTLEQAVALLSDHKDRACSSCMIH